jgi:hypothetical protein
MLVSSEARFYYCTHCTGDNALSGKLTKTLLSQAFKSTNL